MPASLAARLGSPRCAFVTGGPREYWPGISCIAARLAALGTAHPVLAMVLYPNPNPKASPKPNPEPNQVLAMVPPEDEEDARASIKHATVVAWKQFPHAYSKSTGWLYRSPRMPHRARTPK